MFVRTFVLVAFLLGGIGAGLVLAQEESPVPSASSTPQPVYSGPVIPQPSPLP